MQPAIPVGSVIFTQKKNLYKKGDIISFKRGNITITHRIVNATKEKTFITKGDANQSNDKTTVLQQDILGRQVFTLPYLGRFLLFLKTGPGFLTFVIFPAVLFIISEFYIIKKEIEKELEKKLVNRIIVS
jgi:signal peptidase